MNKNSADMQVLRELLGSEDVFHAYKSKLRPEFFSTKGYRALFERLIELDTVKAANVLVASPEASKALNMVMQVGLSGRPADVITEFIDICLVDKLKGMMFDIANGSNDTFKSYQDYYEIIKMSLEHIEDFEDGAVDKPVHISEYLHEAYSDLVAPPEEKEAAEFEMPWSSVSKIVSVERGRLYTVSARTGCGKSVFMNQLCREFAKKKFNSLVFSFEMKGKEVAKRSLSGLANINTRGIHEHVGHGWGDQHTLADAVHTLKQSNILIYDKSGKTADQICSIARAAHRKEKLDIMYIDYLALLDFNYRGDTGSKSAAIGKATKKFKNLAMELDIPVIILAQLNREVKIGVEPQLYHLADSAEIERDSDCVIMLDFKEDDRDKYINELLDKKSPTPFPALLHIRKNRGGELATLRVGFQIETGVIHDYDPAWDEKSWN